MTIVIDIVMARISASVDDGIRSGEKKKYFQSDKGCPPVARPEALDLKDGSKELIERVEEYLKRLCEGCEIPQYVPKVVRGTAMDPSTPP